MSNVVRLPTAAPRKVQQRLNKSYREQKAAMIASQPRTFDHKWPAIREAEAEAELINQVTRTPELAIALAIFQTLSDGDQRRARVLVDIMALTSESAKQASALIRQRNIGQINDVMQALDRLHPRSNPTGE